jgi:Hsp20/alpha crystallin family
MTQLSLTSAILIFQIVSNFIILWISPSLCHVAVKLRKIPITDRFDSTVSWLFISSIPTDTKFTTTDMAVVPSPSSEANQSTKYCEENSQSVDKPQYVVIDNDDIFKVVMYLPGYKSSEIQISNDGECLSVVGCRFIEGDGYSFASYFTEVISFVESKLDSSKLFLNIEKFSADINSNGILTISTPKLPHYQSENAVREILVTSLKPDERIGKATELIAGIEIKWQPSNFTTDYHHTMYGALTNTTLVT